MAKLLDTNSLSGVFHEIKQEIGSAFDNLTAAQKAELKLKFSDLTQEEKEEITGPQGPQGLQGNSAVFDPDDPSTPSFEMATSTGQSTTKSMTQKAITDALDGIKIDRWETVNMGTRLDGVTSDTGDTGSYSSGNSKFRVYKKQFSAGDILEISRAVAPSSNKYIFVLAGTVEPAVGAAYTNRLYATDADTPTFKVVMPFDGWLGIRCYLTDNNQAPIVKKAVMWKDAVNTAIESINATVNDDFTVQLASYDSTAINDWTTGYWIDGNNKYNSSTAKGRFLDVTDYRGKTMILTARASRTAVYAFLVDLSNWQDNSSPNFVSETQSVTVAGGTTTEVTIPNTATYLYVEYQKGNAETATNLTYPASVVITGTLKSTLDSTMVDVGKEKTPYIHVDYVNGSNSNDGLTTATAVKTVAKALELSGQDARIMLHGDTPEYIYFGPKRRVTITNAPGEKARIVRGNKITEATLDNETGIYSVDVTDMHDSTFGHAQSAANYWIYQHNVPDVSTLISNNERHPLQRGATYRCGSARLTRYTSLASLQADETGVPAYYYDSSEHVLYFKIAENTTLETNPIVLPKYNDRGFRAADSEVHLVGIDVLYGYVALTKCVNSTLTDCSASYAYGGENDSCGCFVLWSCRDITFTRCEAARCTLGNSGATGDGFNIHLAVNESFDDRREKYMTATLIDCWGHDNIDEGASDHGRSEVTYIGGLYEHNGTGVAPAVGSCSTFYNVIFRSNDTEGLRNGASISGTAETVGVGTCTTAFNCLSENNGGRGFENSNGKSGRPNTMTLIGCMAIGNTGVGFYSSGAANNPMYLYNCSTSGNGSVVSNATSIINTTLVPVT